MVTLEQIRLDMEKKLKFDKDIKAVTVMADNLEDCLADAAVQLETQVKNLEYEVMQKGFPGIIGIAKKPWKVKVYENPDLVQKKSKVTSDIDIGEEETVAEQHVDRDGIFYIRHFGDKICLKVLLPLGDGTPVKEKKVLEAASRPDTLSLDEQAVKHFVKDGTGGIYQEIGKYSHQNAGDAIIAIDCAKDEMSASVLVSPPSMGGADASKEAIVQALKIQGVVCGISDEKIEEFVDNPVYNVPCIVAEAIPPLDGHDAYIAYNFETDQSKMRIKQTKNGQVDFKELNLIQNVVKGQPLAQKMLPQKGKGGKTIMGRYLEAKNGKDINVILGKNTAFDSDGRTIIATENGQVLLIGDRITVEEVKEVDGVNIKTGNITFMGTVICKGNVEDGYSIKANGNIEVYGSVGNCHLEAEGDIVISQGVMGRNEGEIKTPKSIWARFIQNAKVEAGEYIIVNDNIMNSDVTAMKKILLKGKRAQIIGGHLFATEEITAKNIGSPGGGMETVLEVGYDPVAKKRLLELQEMQGGLTKELEEIDLNINTLENQKKVRRSLPHEKEESLKKFTSRKNEIKTQIEEWAKEIEGIEARLRELRVVGKVNASGTVYPGVKIFVRDEKDEVKNEVKSVSFYYDGGFVRRGKYDSSSEAEIRGPDGYSSD